MSSNLIYLVQKSHKFISVSPSCAFGGNLWLHILRGDTCKSKTLFTREEKQTKAFGDTSKRTIAMFKC